MSLQAKLSRKIENARKRNAKKVLQFFPEKEPCLSCCQYVVAGLMGLSCYFSSHAQCSLYSSGDSSLLDGTMMSEAQSGKHRPVSTFHAGVTMSLRWGIQMTMHVYSSMMMILVPPFFRSGQWPWGIIHWCCACYLEQRGIWTSASSNVAPSSGNSDSQLNFPNTFDDAWSKRDINDGLNLSTFSLEEEVQLDLLETLKSLRRPMIAYDEVMNRAIRSCSRGHSFRDIPISSCKTVMGNFRDCVDFEGWPPCWSSFISCNQTATLMLFISEPMLSLILSNWDKNYIFHDPDNSDVNPFARPSGSVLGDINTGKSYLKTYDLLIKKPGDILLPCVLAIDKTICNIGGGGKLSLEPIVVSYGLIAHDMRKTPAAMRVLGFINTTPFKERAFQPGEVRPNTPHL